jgi:arylsulfatase A-like enzyme
MWMDGNWKLIDNSLDGSVSYELYDVRNDPKEALNLAADVRQKDRVAHFTAQIARVRKDRPEPVRITGMSTPAYAQVDSAERQELERTAPDLAEQQQRARKKKR